jgi:large subunit ribosomal protein L21
MHAIIRTGGKQYLVAEGTKLKVEKLDEEVGAAVSLEVLFVGDEGKKVTGIRHKAKKREMTRYGHRQPYTEVEITKIKA